MKKLFLGLIFLFIMAPVLAQRIERIRPVASGDTILISYDLLGGPSGQSYKIRASCWDGIGKTELKSIQGLTVVKAGRDHQIRWRVLDDMDLLVGDSITFTLIASEYTPPIGGWTDKSLTIEDQKVLMIMDLTSQIDTYLNEVFNQAKLFQGYSEGKITTRVAAVNLDKQREKLNAAYNTLLKNRRTFELSIYMLWKDKAKTAADDFFKTTLDEMHSEHILPLNDYVMKKINEYNTFGSSNYRSKKLLKEIEDKTFALTNPLLTGKIVAAREKAQKLYETLLL